MGGSVSSNVAEQISSITNNISQNTVVNQTQIDNTSSAINLTQCNITAGANVNMSILNKNVQTAKQIVSATQNATVTNDIQQKLLQEANSTVGALGIGYADASNASSQMANSSTTISNAMNVASNQISITSSDINCTNSTITAQGSVAFTIGSDSNFISNQTVSNKQVTNVANTISQTAQQKATASVEGLTGLLLAVALIIIALGFTVGKTGNTAAIQIIIVIIVVGIILFLYIKEAPPFFDKDLDCVIGGRNGSTIYDSTNCVNTTTSSSTVLTQPPLRYLLPIIDVNNKPNLCQVLISIAGNGTNNNGYNQYIAQLLHNFSTNYQSLLTLAGITGATPFTNTTAFILSVPPGNPGIPIEYRVDMGNGGGSSGSSGSSNTTSAGSCTPGFLMWTYSNGSNTYYDNNNKTTIDKALTSSQNQLGSCPQSAYVNIDETNIPGSTTSTALIQNMAWLDINSINSTLYQTNGSANLTAQMTMRFILCSMINQLSGDDILPLNIYINPSEYVTIPIKDINGNTYNITNTASFITSMIIDPSGQNITMLYNTTIPPVAISNQSITLMYDSSGIFYSSSITLVPSLQSITLLPVSSITNPSLSSFSFSELSNLKQKLLHYQPSNAVCGTDFNLPCVGSPGTISAQTGKVNNNAYKFHKFSNIVLISVLGLLVLYFIVSHFFKGSGNNTTTSNVTSSTRSSSTSKSSSSGSK